MPGKTITVKTLRELSHQLKIELCVRAHLPASPHNTRSMCAIEEKANDATLTPTLWV